MYPRATRPRLRARESARNERTRSDGICGHAPFGVWVWTRIRTAVHQNASVRRSVPFGVWIWTRLGIKTHGPDPRVRPNGRVVMASRVLGAAKANPNILNPNITTQSPSGAPALPTTGRVASPIASKPSFYPQTSQPNPQGEGLPRFHSNQGARRQSHLNPPFTPKHHNPIPRAGPPRFRPRGASPTGAAARAGRKIRPSRRRRSMGLRLCVGFIGIVFLDGVEVRVGT